MGWESGGKRGEEGGGVWCRGVEGVCGEGVVGVV